MSKISKISASHILIMHKESQSSRSELSVNEAKKKLIVYTMILQMEKLNFQMQLFNTPTVPLVKLGAAWESLQRV